MLTSTRLVALQAYPSQSSDPVGVIVCKQSMHRDVTNRGYIAMLSVHKNWRKRGIGAFVSPVRPSDIARV